LSEETKEKITKHFLAAECSDWFWWYGDDHYTEFGVEFDQLFREHLLSVYNLMNVSAPSDLYEPIIKDRSLKDFLIKPQSHISPSINGYHDSFFEWVGCGVVDESKMFSTMDKVRGPIKKILYGQDEDYLYFALEHKEQNSTADCDGLNVFIEPIGFVSKVEFSGKQSEDSKDISIKLVSKKWIEFMVDKKNIDAQEIRIRFELFKDEQIVQSLPGFGELEISLKTDYSENWFV
jgi:hypothetical protein